jgi:hypothetical protein
MKGSPGILTARLFVSAALVLVLGAGVVLAEQKEKKPRKGHAYHGVIQAIDPNAGTLTLALHKSKKHPEVRTKEFTVGQTTRVVIFEAGDKKELVGKEGLSNTHLKQGARVTVLTDHEHNVTVIEVGHPKHPKNPKRAKEPQPPGESGSKDSQ